MDKLKPLTEKQYSFVTNYIKNGFNAYQAARDAGYSEYFARTKTLTLVEHPNIKHRIEKAFQKVEQRIEVSFDWRINKLKRLIDAIIPDDTTKAINVRQGKTAIAAMAELNKMFGDYAPDKRLSVTVDATKERLQEARRQYEEY